MVLIRRCRCDRHRYLHGILPIGARGTVLLIGRACGRWCIVALGQGGLSVWNHLAGCYGIAEMVELHRG
jgi:hypothetical protein